jgi:hypothetical protein
VLGRSTVHSLVFTRHPHQPGMPAATLMPAPVRTSTLALRSHSSAAARSNASCGVLRRARPVMVLQRFENAATNATRTNNPVYSGAGGDTNGPTAREMHTWRPPGLERGEGGLAATGSLCLREGSRYEAPLWLAQGKLGFTNVECRHRGIAINAHLCRGPGLRRMDCESVRS